MQKTAHPFFGTLIIYLSASHSPRRKLVKFVHSKNNHWHWIWLNWAGRYIAFLTLQAISPLPMIPRKQNNREKWNKPVTPLIILETVYTLLLDAMPNVDFPR